MTGLDKILAEIKLRNEQSCEEIRKRSEKEYSEIISEANKKAESIIKDGVISSQKKAEDIIERAKSSAQIQNRAMLLSAKQECITYALETAREYIISLPDEAYFALIFAMISKFSEKREGIIGFSEKDLKRLPQNFNEKLNEASKGELILSDKALSIDGGFILFYGDIEINCAFKALFSDNNERFSDEVSKILFT